MAPLDHLHRWRRWSDNPLARFLPIFVFGSVPAMAVAAYFFFGGTDLEWLILPVIGLIVAVDAIAYFVLKRILERTPDNLSRFYAVSFAEAAERLEGAMTDSGIKFMRYTNEEYKLRGTIEGLKEKGWGNDLAWIYQLDSTRAVILHETEYPKCHCCVVLYPYEEPGIHLMNKVRDVADAALLS